MTIFHFILAWLGVFALMMMGYRVRDNVRSGRRFWDFAPFNFLIVASFFGLLAWFSIYLLHPEPDLSTPEAKIRHGQVTRQPWITTEGYSELIKNHPDSIELHHERLYYHFQQRDEDFQNPDPATYLRDEQKLYTYYTDLSIETNSRLHDIGHIMLAYFFLSQSPREYAAAADHLAYVDDPTTKYVNYFAGDIMFSTSGMELAEEHFFSEIRNKGYKEGALRYLAAAYNETGADSSLWPLVYSDAAPYIDDNIKSRVYYEEGDFLGFYRHKFMSAFRNLNAWSVSGGVAIMLVWMYFLWSLTFVSRISFAKLFIPLGAGVIFATTSWWIYAIYRAHEFSLNGEIVNDAIFSFAGVGLIEETVKLIPFLLILLFTKLVKRPIDYIVVASACGLGFAVFENLMYIADYGLDVIHSRALTSSLSHMACSAIVAYGFVLRRYRWTTHWWLIPLFFIFATAAHGFYDFWLLNEKVRSLGIITLLFFLSEILIYISFINNALNQSVEIGGENQELHLNAQRLTSVLAGSFVLLFAFEYIAICFVYGTQYGNSSLTKAFLSGGYLLFFLSVRMAQIRIEAGKWNRINFLSGILPSQMYTRKDEENY